MEEVRIYYNTQHKCLSLQTYLLGWRVSSHVKEVLLANVRVLTHEGKTVLQGIPSTDVPTDLTPTLTTFGSLTNKHLYEYVHILVDDSGLPTLYTYA